MCKGTEAERASAFMHQKESRGAGVWGEKGSTGGEGWELQGVSDVQGHGEGWAS